MTKTLCKLAKQGKLTEREASDPELFQDARLICAKCGRMANKKKRLCKPKKAPGA